MMAMLPRTPEMARTDHPVDLNHLDCYTGGDRATNEEILRLFDDQCRQMLMRLELAAGAQIDAKTWRETTHTLKGAAHGIGAFGLGDAAAEAEQAGTNSATAVAALQRLRQDCAAVGAFIAQFLHGTS